MIGRLPRLLRVITAHAPEVAARLAAPHHMHGTATMAPHPPDRAWVRYALHRTSHRITPPSHHPRTAHHSPSHHFSSHAAARLPHRDARGVRRLRLAQQALRPRDRRRRGRVRVRVPAGAEAPVRAVRGLALRLARLAGAQRTCVSGEVCIQRAERCAYRGVSREAQSEGGPRAWASRSHASSVAANARSRAASGAGGARRKLAGRTCIHHEAPSKPGHETAGGKASSGRGWAEEEALPYLGHHATLVRTAIALPPSSRTLHRSFAPSHASASATLPPPTTAR